MTTQHMLQADEFLAWYRLSRSRRPWDEAFADWADSTHLTNGDRREVRRLVDAALRKTG